MSPLSALENKSKLKDKKRKTQLVFMAIGVLKVYCHSNIFDLNKIEIIILVLCKCKLSCSTNPTHIDQIKESHKRRQ